jgi:hypothetical protein
LEEEKIICGIIGRNRVTTSSLLETRKLPTTIMRGSETRLRKGCGTYSISMPSTSLSSTRALTAFTKVVLLLGVIAIEKYCDPPAPPNETTAITPYNHHQI